jgi:hypothetical protein
MNITSCSSDASVEKTQRDRLHNLRRHAGLLISNENISMSMMQGIARKQCTSFSYNLIATKTS